MKTFKQLMDERLEESAWGKDKRVNLQAAHNRHEESAIKANKAGDHEAVKVHQRKMNMIKNQMNKLRKEDIGLDESNLDKSSIEQHLANKDINSSVEGNVVKVHRDNLAAAKRHVKRAGFSHKVVAGLTEGLEELEEAAAWERAEGKNPEGGLNRKGIESYRRENPGSKLSMAVTTKPSKLKPGSKAANRRKSFCSRMGGMKRKLTSAKTARDPDSRINKALRKWNC